MDLFLFITGFVAMLIAFGLLILRVFTKGPKKKLLILLAAGFALFVTGALIGGANMTPEEKAVAEERRLAKAEEKEAKLEAERLEKEKTIEVERKELEKKELAERERAEEETAEALRNEQEEKAVAEKKKSDPLAIKEVEGKAGTEKNEGSTGIIPIFDIKDVAHKTESEVTDLLGKPFDTEEGDFSLDVDSPIYTLNYYKDGKIEVMFIEDKAVNVILNLSEEEYFSGEDAKGNLEYLNLTVTDLEKPLIEGQTSVGAYNIDGFHRVEVGKWRNVPGGFVTVFTDKKYKY
ncbi:hypothetical protein [Sporosarcina sp. FSL K6-1508]|uniref:hypothetical protein n=1 Tax=Sporosarcina sp. FSL K6-1508 TaxID=2921553 RepID=UPI0030FC6D37